jgi:hypothetical protein
MNPTAAYFAQLKEYAAEQRRQLAAVQQTLDLLPCPFHKFCFYEESLGHCKEWTPEPTPDWLAPEYEEEVAEWQQNTTDIPLLTIDELIPTHDDVLASTLRHVLVGQRHLTLHRLGHRATSTQPRSSPRSVLSPAELPAVILRLEHPAGHTPTHRYPLRSLYPRAATKDVEPGPGPSNVGRNIKRREQRAKKPYGRR